MGALVQFSSQLETIECVQCGVLFAAPAALITRARRIGKFEILIWCPSGHSQGWGDSEIDKLKAKVAEARDLEFERRTRREREAKDAERERKRIARRARAGACPCCQRNFVALARHMKTKHPEYGQP